MNFRRFYAVLSVVLFSIMFVSCATDDPFSEISDDDQVVSDESVSDDEEVVDNTTVQDEDDVKTEEDVTDDEVSDESDDTAQVDETSDVDEETTDDEGSSNLNTGDTSGQQAAAGNPGAACTKDEDCNNWAGTGNDDEQYAICLLPTEGYPEGYCSFMCDGSVALNHGCNGYNGVYYGWGTYGDGYCFHPCDDPNDCRVGYRCSQTVGACMPDCEVDACQKGTCDETEKVCL